MFGWFKKKGADLHGNETRSAASGFTAEILSAREAYISGRRGIAELTATAQACVSLFEHSLSLADVDGTTLLDPMSLALAGRSVALRGEALFLITDDGLVPCADWDLSTRNAKPRAYRVSISEAGGGRTETVLAGEVLHLRIGCDPVAPYYGTAPLRRASLTSGLLQAIETALGETFENAPLGSQIVPFPEAPETDSEQLGRAFRGQRGRVLLRESVNVAAAGGPTPNTDWRPSDLTPNLEKAMALETLEAGRNAICAAFGVLPAMFAPNAQGPAIRECQRHVCQYTLTPIAYALAHEATVKLGTPVKIDVARPLQAYDAGGRARALMSIVQAMAAAKEAGVDPDKALTLVDWSD